MDHDTLIAARKASTARRGNPADNLKKKRRVPTPEREQELRDLRAKSASLRKTDPEKYFATRDVRMTPMQVAFAREWAQGNSPYSSALRAGYASGAMSHELVRLPAIVALYEKEKKKYEEAADMTRKKVMDMFQEAYDMAKLMAEPQAMVAAAREVGKMCGYYAPVERKIKIEGSLTYDRMNKLSDAELLELVEQGNGQVSTAVTEELAQIAHEEREDVAQGSDELNHQEHDDDE